MISNNQTYPEQKKKIGSDFFLDPNGPQLRGAGWNSQLHSTRWVFFKALPASWANDASPKDARFRGGGGFGVTPNPPGSAGELFQRFQVGKWLLEKCDDFCGCSPKKMGNMDFETANAVTKDLGAQQPPNQVGHANSHRKTQICILLVLALTSPRERCSDSQMGFFSVFWRSQLLRSNVGKVFHLQSFKKIPKSIVTSLHNQVSDKTWIEGNLPQKFNVKAMVDLFTIESPHGSLYTPVTLAHHTIYSGRKPFFCMDLLLNISQFKHVKERGLMMILWSPMVSELASKPTKPTCAMQKKTLLVGTIFASEDVLQQS